MLKSKDVSSVSAVIILILGLFFCLSPWVSYSFGKVGNTHRVAELLTIGAALISLGISAPIGWTTKKNVSLWFGGLYCVGLLCCVGALIVSARSEFPLKSIQDFGLLSGGVALFLSLNRRLKDFSLSDLEMLGLLLLAPGIAYSFQLIILYIEMISYSGFGLHYSKLPHFSNFRPFNNLQAILIPVYLYYVFAYKGPWLKVVRGFAGFVACIWCLALLYTGARSVMVAFFCVLVFCVIYYPSLLRPFRASALKFGVLLLLMYGVLFLVVPYCYEGEAQVHAARTYTGDRRELWGFSIGKISECLWGCGGQSFVVLTSRDFNAPWGSPHNIILSLLIEYGVLLGAVMLGSILLVVKILVDTVKSVFELALLSSILACGIDSLFSGAIYAPLVGMSLPIVMAFLLSRVSGVGEFSRLNLGAIQTYVRLGFFTFLHGFFILSVWISFLDLKFYGYKIAELVFSYPRFWEVGNFFL